ncbi:MAG: hypothetical protein AB7N80_08990 [Bdellovibrionales bacterium]
MGLYLNLRHLLKFSGLSALLFLAFQNCGVVPQECADRDSSVCANSQTSSPSTTNSRSQSGNINVGGGTSGGGNTFPGGEGSPGFPGGGGSGGGLPPIGSQPVNPGTLPPPTSGGFVPGPLRITAQPQSRLLATGAEFTIFVQVNGGTPPYTFRWTFNNQPDTSPYNASSAYYGVASRYDQEGSYYVTITDAAGGSVRSATANVTIQDAATNCPSRLYYGKMANNQYFDFFSSLFENTRGTFYLPATHEELQMLNLDSFSDRTLSDLGLSRAPNRAAILFGTAPRFPAANFGGVANMSCRFLYPRIHNPTPNPSYNVGDFQNLPDQYEDSTTYRYEGSVNFECRGGKWQYRSNTCQWRFYPPPPDFGGGA